MPNHYTYLHRRGDTGELFYVGKGTGQRAWSKSKRNEYWHNIVNAHGYSVEVSARWSAAEEAFEHEKFLIWCFRDMGAKLCNMTDGGDGLCNPSKEVRERIANSLRGRTGRPMKETTKELLREQRTGAGNPMYGKTVSEEAKEKQKKSLAASGYKHSPETFKKISKALRNGYHPMRGLTGSRHHSSKPVVCVETSTKFGSIGEAVRWLQANGHERARDWNICAACNGKRKSAYGMHWRYHNDEAMKEAA